MAGVAPPPPSYESVVGKIEPLLKGPAAPEKVLEAVSNLSPQEIKVVTQGDNVNANAKVVDGLNDIDKDAFNQGVADYVNSEAAKLRMQVAADDATKGCRLIDKMFGDLSFKLGEIDGRNIGDVKFLPKLQDLQKTYRDLVHESKNLALDMARYAKRWDDMILKAVLEPKFPLKKKKELLDKYIGDATGFETKSKLITDTFDLLRQNFGALVGSFDNWAKGEDTKLDDQIDKLRKEIEAIDDEIAKIKKNMILTGLIGAPLLVGGTALACAFLGPIGLIAGLIGAGVTIGLMIHWNNQINERNDRKAERVKSKKALETQKDSIVAARAQLKELGSGSLKTFSDQISKLSAVWEYARNDAHAIQGHLSTIKDDLDNVEFEFVRNAILKEVGTTQGIYSVLAIYLQRYADGVVSDEVPKKA